MRPISWLHISDIHMRPRDAWPQHVVMTAMCDDIRAKRTEHPVDFVLVTGDLAFGGKIEEYDLVRGYLDELSAASGVPADRMFCIPGNHDINRDRQRFCFQGARSALQDSASTDAFLGASDADDFAPILGSAPAFRGTSSNHAQEHDHDRLHQRGGWLRPFTAEDCGLTRAFASTERTMS